MSDVVTTTAEFDGAVPALRWGKLFAAGSYADKQYAMTADELKAAVMAFEPVPVDLEHTPTMLSGKLGTLQQVKLAEDGTTLLGGVEEPAWLTEVLGDMPRKVSCTWDRATKHLRGLAYTLNPRVPDAALMAAFTASFAGKRHNASDQQKIQDVHDHAVALGADCAPANAKMSRERPMAEKTRLEKFMDWLSGEGTDAQFTTPTPPAVVSKQPDPELERLKAENARKDAELATFKQQQAQKDAVAFADAEIAANRALPAERDGLIAAFAQAAVDDAAHGLVTFGTVDKSSRVDELKARQSQRVPHRLTDELVPGVHMALDPNQGGTSQADELAKRRKEAREYGEQQGGTRA